MGAPRFTLEFKKEDFRRTTKSGYSVARVSERLEFLHTDPVGQKTQ